MRPLLDHAAAVHRGLVGDARGGALNGGEHRGRALIADVGIAGVPEPMPVVMKSVLVKWQHRGNARPGVVIHALGHRRIGFAPDVIAQLHIPAGGFDLPDLVGKLFGVRYLATLFGLTLLSHQIGGFLGAWLGGLAVMHFGDFTWMWYADMALAVLAALVNLPIREARIAPALAVA